MEVQHGFQSTLPARGATFPVPIVTLILKFQSTLPARGATSNAKAATAARVFQSTLPARGATGSGPTGLPAASGISIHAPREGSDLSRYPLAPSGLDFNPRSPRGERPGPDLRLRRAVFLFQSTLPARGATSRCTPSSNNCLNFNPRSPRGERPPARQTANSRRRFQSTLPARGATCNFLLQIWQNLISIHAPREGSDIFSFGIDG